MDLSEKELDELRFGFDLLDQDGEGIIQAKDLAHFLHCLGRNPTDGEVESMINQFDSDGNGCIFFAQFVRGIMLRLTIEPDEDEMREAFRVYDPEDTGYIGVDQLRKVMIRLGLQPTDDELEEIILEGDEDADQYLSYEEFANIVKPH